MAERVRCFECGADITGLMSIETDGSESVQRSTCYEPEDCVSRLHEVAWAWKTLAIAQRCRKRAEVKKAVARLVRLGEIKPSAAT